MIRQAAIIAAALLVLALLAFLVAGVAALAAQGACPP